MDANPLSHRLEFNHKTIFSLVFVFNLDIFKCLAAYPKPIRSDLPPQTNIPFPFAQQAWLPLLRADLASSVSTLTSTISFLMLGEDSHCPARPVSLTSDDGEITLHFRRRQPQGAFRVSWERRGGSSGHWHG